MSVVSLSEKPSKQQILTLTKAMKSADKNTMEQILQTLYINQRHLISNQSKKQISFSMNNIHYATYMKICKLLKIEGGQNLIE